MKIKIAIIKYIYRIYNYFFFQIFHSAKYRYKKAIESYIPIKLLRYSTEYIIYARLENLYVLYKEYDGLDPKGMLLYPRRIKEMSKYSYLVNVIWIGYHPTLENNPITLDEILKLNLHKDDKQYTIFLETFLKYYWDNPGKCISRWNMNNMIGINI